MKIFQCLQITLYVVFSYEEAIVNARELERQKQEQTISELKQRVDALLASRQELETRCKQYSRELHVSEALVDKIHGFVKLLTQLSSIVGSPSRI